jgi:hypothetical protein
MRRHMNGDQGRRQVKALCCDCGQLRTLSTDNWGRRGDSDIGLPFTSAEHLASCHSSGHFLEVRLHWRSLRTLNCSACDAWTRHAVVFGRPTSPNDPDELTNYEPRGFTRPFPPEEWDDV